MSPTPSPTTLSPTTAPSRPPTMLPTTLSPTSAPTLTDLATVDDIAWLEEQLPQGKKIGTRLFKATIDGGTASDFHAACDNKGMLLFLVEATNGYRFGAFAGKPWSSVTGYKSAAAGEPRPFLFGLPGGGRSDPERLDLVAGQEGYAYWHSSIYGPSFGKGPDLLVRSSNGNGATYGGNSYEQPASGRYALSGGTSSRYFQCADYEVYQIV